MHFQSDRLAFRLINDSDFPHIYCLQVDPVAMHFIRPVITEGVPAHQGF